MRQSRRRDPWAERTGVGVVRGSRDLPPGFAHPLRSVRRGELPLPEVLAAVAAAEQELVRLQDASQLPPEPDRAWVDGWLHRAHEAYWARSG